MQKLSAAWKCASENEFSMNDDSKCTCNYYSTSEGQEVAEENIRHICPVKTQLRQNWAHVIKTLPILSEVILHDIILEV